MRRARGDGGRSRDGEVKAPLTKDEQLRGAKEGYERQKHAVEDGLVSRHNNGSAWGCHIEGACSELALAVLTGQPWTGEGFRNGPGRRPPPDVGEDIEVRWVAPEGKYLNMDARRDIAHRRYVLLRGYCPEYEVLGWIWGREMTERGFKVEYPERVVYRVPLDKLRDFKLAVA